MATKTTNYNLIKTELTDDADIRVINGNMDVLDNQLKSISDKADNASDNAYSDVTVSSDYTWKFTKGSGTNVSYDTIKTATAVKNTTGIARITANNGAVSNVFEVTTSAGGSRYNFNGESVYYNSATDVFYVGNHDQYKLAVNKSVGLQVAKPNSDVFYHVPYREIYTDAWDNSWTYMTDDLLIQGGRVRVGDNMTNITLPRPYANVNTYILYVSDNSYTGTLSAYAVAGKKVSNTTIGLHYFSDRYVTWLTIGGRN